MNAKMGLERRAVIDAALNRGWEIVAHNYVQTELLADYSFDENKEREVIRETLRFYRRFAASRPRDGFQARFVARLTRSTSWPRKA